MAASAVSRLLDEWQYPAEIDHLRQCNEELIKRMIFPLCRSVDALL